MSVNKRIHNKKRSVYSSWLSRVKNREVMSAYFLSLSGNIRKKLFLYQNTLRHTTNSPSSQQTIFFKTAQKLIWMLPWRHRKRSYLMYRLLNSSQIARATIGQRKMIIIDGTGTSVRWNTKGACWLHPTWDNVK